MNAANTDGVLADQGDAVRIDLLEGQGSTPAVHSGGTRTSVEKESGLGQEDETARVRAGGITGPVLPPATSIDGLGEAGLTVVVPPVPIFEQETLQGVNNTAQLEPLFSSALQIPPPSFEEPSSAPSSPAPSSTRFGASSLPLSRQGSPLVSPPPTRPGSPLASPPPPRPGSPSVAPPVLRLSPPALFSPPSPPPQTYEAPSPRAEDHLRETPGTRLDEYGCETITGVKRPADISIVGPKAKRQRPTGHPEEGTDLMIVEGSFNSLPSHAPEWCTRTLLFFKRLDQMPGIWSKLVNTWVQTEIDTEFNGSRKLSAKHRPTCVSYWISTARPPHQGLERVGSLEELNVGFWQWWKGMQPAFRQGTDSNGGLLGEITGPEDVEGAWDEIAVTGKNGFTSVLAVLCFWGLVISKKPTDGYRNQEAKDSAMTKWSAAVDDVNFVLAQVRRHSCTVGRDM